MPDIRLTLLAGVATALLVAAGYPGPAHAADTTPQDATPQDATPQGAASEGTTPQPATPQAPTAQAPTAQAPTPQPVTPQAAASYEAQVRDTVAHLAGPAVKLPERPIRITADGDHYDLAVPFAIDRLLGFGAPIKGPPASATAEITGAARLGSDGIWTVNGVTATTPLAFTLLMPVPASDDDPAAPKKTIPVAYTVTQQDQDGHITWDPTFRTASTWTASSQHTAMHATGNQFEQTTSVGPTTATTTLRPAGPDRLDILLAGELQDYTVDSTVAAMATHLAFKNLHLTGAVNNTDRNEAVELLRAVSTLLATHLPDSSPAKPPQIKAVLASLQNLASDFNLDETVDGAALQVMGQAVTMDHLRLGLDARSEAGLVRAGMNFGLDGIALPDFPLGSLAALLPQRIELRPVLGGVAAKDLLHMADLAVDDIDPSQADINALFSHGGVTGGVESMTVEVGGATFTGQGQVVATSPTAQSVTATAQVTAQNFDALMQRLESLPALSQQALPVMVFIKGIGRNADDKLVWDISYRNGRMLVNNVDLTAMTGSGPAAGPAPQPPAGGALKRPPTRPTAPNSRR